MLNATSANKHAHKIECQTCAIKECMRVTRHTLPFKVIPLTTLIKLIHQSSTWINAFSPKGDVSSAQVHAMP
jgi:hypothetical protein